MESALNEPCRVPIKVLYTGAITDFSGYAAAAREYIHALDHVGVDIVADARSFEPNNPSHLVDEVVGRRLYTLMGKDRSSNVHIIHLTPDLYWDYMADQRIRIGYFAWETSRLPSKWVDCLNSTGLSEAWVPCEYLRRVAIQSGVTVPVVTVPHVIPVTADDWVPPCKITGLPSDKYKFYSVFQWSERKNPTGLLRAYYQEFCKDDPVILVLKTYRLGNNLDERSYVRREISKLKREIKGVNAPPVLLVEEFLSDAEVKSLHYYCDCYISMARNEGFGIPAFEAAAFGNPVIVPNYSAFADHFNDSNGYLVDVPNEKHIEGMRHISILYTGDMVWGDPDISSCQRRMREAFENQAGAKARGIAAREYVKKNLSHATIGRMMKGRIENLVVAKG